MLKETISRHEDGVKKRNCIDEVKSGSPKELLWKELTTQTRDRGSGMLADGAAVLVAPGFGGIQHGQRRGQVGDVFILPAEPRVPDPALICSGEMQDHDPMI